MSVLDRILAKHAGCPSIDCEDGIAKPKPSPAPPAQLKPLPPPGAAEPGVAAASLPKIAGWVARDRNAEWRDVAIDPSDPDSCHYWDDMPSKEQRDYEDARDAYAKQKFEERWGDKLRSHDPAVTKELLNRGHLGMGLGALGTAGAFGTLYAMTRSKHPLVRSASLVTSAIPGAMGLAMFGKGLGGYGSAYKYKHADPTLKSDFNKDYLKRHGTDVDAIAWRQEREDREDYDRAHRKQFDKIYEWSDDED